jgi:2-C-methyl-D-erythritol 4-phosphate cytidylyltransferase
MPNVSIILLAGGTGSRFGGETPKQYLELEGKPVILHSYEVLQEFGEMIVVADPAWRALFSGLDCRFAAPGRRRQDSVFNGLKEASGEWILIHDGARPFISKQEVKALLEALERAEAAALATPLKSTLKRVDSDLNVQETLPREALWEIRTPQVVLRRVLEKGFEIADKKGITVTDDLSLAELCGAKAVVVPGSEDNIKITTPADWAAVKERMRQCRPTN